MVLTFLPDGLLFDFVELASDLVESILDRLSVRAFDHLCQLHGQVDLVCLPGDLGLDGGVDLQDECDDDVHEDDGHEAPEADEEDLWVGMLTHYILKHVDCHKPVVDDHKVEECDQRRCKGVKVQQVVESWSFRRLLLDSLRVDGTAVQARANDGVQIEDNIEENELADDRRGQILHRLRDDLELADLGQ